MSYHQLGFKWSPIERPRLYYNTETDEWAIEVFWGYAGEFVGIGKTIAAAQTALEQKIREHAPRRAKRMQELVDRDYNQLTDFILRSCSPKESDDNA